MITRGFILRIALMHDKFSFLPSFLLIKYLVPGTRSILLVLVCYQVRYQVLYEW